MSQPRCEVIGDCTLWLGDCLTLVPQFDTRWAVVSDPPYGIAYARSSRRPARVSALAGSTFHHRATPTWQQISGDSEPVDISPWLRFHQVILWGGNHYAGLPPARCWLLWDKRKHLPSDNHGDAELAWTNLSGVIRIHRQISRGGVREGEENVVHEQRCHPHQKPLALMAWCLQMTTGTVLDPYMGSATTGLAALRLGRRFVGVEIEEKYHTIACRRIEAAHKQPDLFLEHAKRQAPVQARLFATEER